MRWKQKESGRFADEAKDEGVMQTFADEEKEGDRADDDQRFRRFVELENNKMIDTGFAFSNNM